MRDKVRVFVLPLSIPQSNPQKTFLLPVSRMVELKGFSALKQGMKVEPYQKLTTQKQLDLKNHGKLCCTA